MRPGRLALLAGIRDRPAYLDSGNAYKCLASSRAIERDAVVAKTVRFRWPT